MLPFYYFFIPLQLFNDLKTLRFVSWRTWLVCSGNFKITFSFLGHTSVRIVTITDQYSWSFMVNVSYEACKVVIEGFCHFIVAAYVISGYSSPAGAIHKSYTFLPLNTINGGNFSPAAVATIKTFMFSLHGPLGAGWKAILVS
jgi:hypothetical protein